MKAASAKAQETANLPFTQYTGDRTADLSPDTLAAFNLARQSIGSTDAINDASLGALGNYGNYSGLATGTQALDAYGRPDLYSNLNMASPLVNNALPALNSSAAAYTQNLLDSSGANAKLPDVIQNYLNPYTQNVVDQIAGLGQRDLTESILPNINKTFVGGGAFGGSRNNEFMSRAVRDTGNNILGQQVNALNTGYNTAASQAQADLGRLTDQAQNLGSQYGSDLSRTIGGTETLSNLLTNAGTSDADRRTAAAKYLEGLGSSDAANQLTYGQNLQEFGSNIYNQNLKDSAVLEGIGQTQQQQEQSEIDSQMAAYNEQANYPYKQLQTLISPLQSIQWPTTTTQTTSGGGSSAFGNVLGTLISGASVAAKAGAFSDRRLKKDISPLGVMKTDKGSYPLYNFKYKGTDTPQQGVMAQDVEKQNPDAVSRVKGYRYVHYDKLAEGGSVSDDEYNRILDALSASPAGRGMTDTRFHRADNSMTDDEMSRAMEHQRQDREREMMMEAMEGGRPNPRYARGGSVRVTDPKTGESFYVDNATDGSLERADSYEKSRKILDKYLKRAHGGAVDGYWGQQDRGQSDQEMLSRTDRHPMTYLKEGNVDMNMPVRDGSSGDRNEIRDQFYMDQRRVLPTASYFKGGGSIHDHTYDAEQAIRGYEEGGSVLDDLLRKIMQGEQQTPAVQDWGADSRAEGSPLLSMMKSVGEFQGRDNTSFPPLVQNHPPPQQQEMPPPEDLQSPLVSQPQPTPVSYSEKMPIVSEEDVGKVRSPLTAKDITWNGPRAGESSPDITWNGPRYQAPKTADDLKQEYYKALMDDKNDQLRSALLKLGVGMIGGQGGFGAQLGRGLQAGAADLDKTQERYLGGLKNVTDIDRRGTNDMLDYMVAKDRLDKTGGVGDKEDSARARAAQAFIDNDPSMLNKSPEEKLAIYDRMTKGGGSSVPGRNIATAAGIPEVGQIVMGKKFKGGNPRDPNSWE